MGGNFKHFLLLANTGLRPAACDRGTFLEKFAKSVRLCCSEIYLDRHVCCLNTGFTKKLIIYCLDFADGTYVGT